MGWLPRHGISPGARGQKGNQIWAMYANVPGIATVADLRAAQLSITVKDKAG